MKSQNLCFCKEEQENPNRLIVDLKAIGKNVRILRDHFKTSMRIMAILKANAYGTNYAELGAYLKEEGIDIVGAANLIEALFFKKVGVEQSIFLLHSFIPDIGAIVENEFEVAVDEKEFIETLQREAKRQGKIIKVHLKVETGMGRFGCAPEEALGLARLIQNSSHLLLEGLSTHFSCADIEEKEAFTYEQYERFCEVLKALRKEGIEPCFRHVANSSAAILFDLPECNMIRVGLALYGIQPYGFGKKFLPLESSLMLKSTIVKVATYKKGHTIGYGSTYIVQKEEEKIAVLPIGYFDGIHQQYRKASFLIRGKRAPIVGKICMDYIMCDVSHIPDVSIGDEAVLFGKDEWGNEISPQVWADLGGCDVRQFICCLGPRIKRILLSKNPSTKQARLFQKRALLRND